MKMWTLLILVFLNGISCSTKRATEEDCALIVNRIVELEMRESGFRDPELTRRKQEHIRKKFQTEMKQCVGIAMTDSAISCVQNAKSIEEISHQCLH